MNKLILKKLIFIGAGKKPAIIDFTPGFNVISGPSDTGKSLICECINYVLGGTVKPKEPPEAKGYTNIFLTVKTQGKEFTIERSVLSNDVKVYDFSYDKITNDTNYNKLSGSVNAKDNLSDFLLNIIGLNGKRLKKNELNETIRLTFNLLRNLLLIDEGRIQAKISPILTGVPTSATQEKALFRFMLTGIDYSNTIVRQKPDIRKADANARINVLNQLINTRISDLKNDISKDYLENQLSKLEISINNTLLLVSVSLKEINELQEGRNKSWNLAISAESKIDQLNEIISRFALLAKHYQTDLDRLDAIIETGDILSSTKDIRCPVCGSEAAYHRPECMISNNEIIAINKSCEYEKIKIVSLQYDLTNTISQVTVELKDFNDLKLNSEKEYIRIDNILNEKLKPSINRLNEDLRQLFDTKKDVELKIQSIGQINDMTQLKANAEQDLKPPPKSEKIPVGAKSVEVDALLKIIEKTLKEWQYPDSHRIGFSELLQDITIGNKNRGEQGKGYRAITHAAFIISIMEYCLDNQMPHPGFVLLDSPLVTFRGADKMLNTDEMISDDIKNQFYSQLCKLHNDRQVIVIENDDPASNITAKMNYVHFTKDQMLGRYGFLPKN
ncbi:MAG: AAA family ATPase [Chlorobiaceae bacterium]